MKFKVLNGKEIIVDRFSIIDYIQVDKDGNIEADKLIILWEYDLFVTVI